MFRRLGRRFRNLLTRDFDLQEQLLAAREQETPFVLPPEAFFDLFEPSTAALEEAKTAALAGSWKEAGQALLDHYHDRLRPQPFVHPTDQENLVGAFKPFAQECRRWLKSAEAALQHRFSPLGGEEYSFGHSIDWYSDFQGGSWMMAPIARLETHFQTQPLSPSQQEALLRTWSFNSHSHLLDLARSYWLTGNEGFASEAIVQAVDWSERNPIFQGINWYDPKTVAARGLHWLLLVHHLLISNLMSGELLTRLLRTVVLHAAYLALFLEEEEPGGHHLVCAAGLYLLSGHLSELSPCKRWQPLARQHLLRACSSDFSKEGLHTSGNLSLHREALDWLLLSYLFDLMNSRGPELHAACENALEALQYLKPPSGQPGESGAPLTEGLLGRFGGPQEHAHRLLTLGSLLLQRSDLNPGSSEPVAELLWWLGPESASKLQNLSKGEPRGSRRLFSAAQVASVRDGWGPRSSWCQLKGTAPRPGAYGWTEPISPPQHDDALSLQLTLEGEPIFLEPGGPMIGGEIARSFARLGAHSCVRVGRELEPLGVAPEPAEPAQKLQLESCRDGHYMCAQRAVWFDLVEPFWLTREVLFLPKKQRVIIRDSLAGEGEVHFESNLLLAPHLDILMRGDMGSLLRGKKLQARILPLFPSRFRYEVLKGRTETMDGFFWSDQARAVPTNLLRYWARLTAPASVCLWIAWNPEDTLSPRPQDVEKLFRQRG